MKLRTAAASQGSMLVLWLAMGVTTGCLTESEPPELATYRIVAAQPVQVITSSRFNSVLTCIAGSCFTSDRVTFITSDTLELSGPLERTVVLETPARFFLRATSLSDGNVVSVEVLIPEEESYDYTRTLGSGESLQYVFCAASLADPLQVTNASFWADEAVGCPVFPGG